MKKISEHKTIHSFWEDLRDYSDGNPNFSPVPRRFYQERLQVAGDTTSVRLIRQKGIGPTCLRVSVARPNSSQRDVTKLDFIDSCRQEAESWQKVGHLVLPPPPGQRARGIHVVNVADIPEAAQSALEVLDRGVRLMSVNAMVPKWIVGRQPEY